MVSPMSTDATRPTSVAVDAHRSPLATREGAEVGALALVAIVVVHTVLWIGLARTLPGGDFVAYPRLGSAPTPWIREVVLPLVVVLALQMAVLVRLGWWRSVWRDPSRSRRRWLWIAPALLLFAGLLVRLAGGELPDSSGYLMGLTLAMLMVGLTEELTFRGIALVGARRLLDSEAKAALATSVAFGLFHLPNVVLGATLGAASVQMVFTAVIGTAIYALRRASGLLWPCVVLHAVYDWLVISPGY